MTLAAPSRLDGPLRRRLESALTVVGSPFSTETELLNGTAHSGYRDIASKVVAQHLSQFPLCAVGDVYQGFLEQIQCLLVSFRRLGTGTRRDVGAMSPSRSRLSQRLTLARPTLNRLASSV